MAISEASWALGKDGASARTGLWPERVRKSDSLLPRPRQAGGHPSLLSLAGWEEVESLQRTRHVAAYWEECVVGALSEVNIESELSYAYIHAIASKAGMAVRSGTRHEDNNGIDATLTAWGPFLGGGYLTEVDLKIQLKATISAPSDDGNSLSYFLKGKKQYDDLRATTQSAPRLLVVLFLPQNPEEWLTHTHDKIELQKCAYWVSLRGAPETRNETGQTVKLPKSQPFNVQGLMNLVVDASRRQFPVYAD